MARLIQIRITADDFRKAAMDPSAWRTVTNEPETEWAGRTPPPPSRPPLWVRVERFISSKLKRIR